MCLIHLQTHPVGRGPGYISTGHGREDKNTKRNDLKRGACFAWNDGRCSTYPCPYKHACSRHFGYHKRALCG